jgi:hypothetical protein
MDRSFRQRRNSAWRRFVARMMVGLDGLPYGESSDAHADWMPDLQYQVERLDRDFHLTLATGIVT